MAGRTDPRHAQVDALSRLARVHGERGMRTAVLALVVDTRDVDLFAAWRRECEGVPASESIREDVLWLDAAQRLPVLEAFESRLRESPKAERRTLLQALRRVVAARRLLRPLDRLHWLQLRRALGDRPAVPPEPVIADSMARLPQSMRWKIGAVTAYLARVIPDGDAETGEVWRSTAIQRFMPLHTDVDPSAPDGDGLVVALEEVEALPWMLRPVLMRAWVDTALEITRRAQLTRDAADALRLTARLLDAPMPPALARHFDELGWTAMEVR